MKIKIIIFFILLISSLHISAQDCTDDGSETVWSMFILHTDSTQKGKKLYYETERARIFFRHFYYKNWIESSLKSDTLIFTRHKLTEVERKSLEMMFETVTSDSDSISINHFESLLVDSLKYSVFRPEVIIGNGMLMQDNSVVVFDKLNKVWVKEFTAWQLTDGTTGYYFSKPRRKMKKKDHFMGTVIEK